jgi:aspartate aminotransferase
MRDRSGGAGSKVAAEGIALDARVDGLAPSATLAMNELAARLVAEGREVFHLGFGQSPFPPPAELVAALRDNAHRCEYLPVRGLPALREAVAAHHSRLHGMSVRADDVLIGPGSKQLMYLVQLALDAVTIVPTPAWVSYAPQARLAGRPCVTVPTDFDDGWRLTPAALEAVCGGLGGRRGLLVLNDPGNPTGATYGEAHLAVLAEVADRHRLLVLSDEIYGDLDHRGRHVSMARFHPDGTLVTSGLSKWCGAGGWRLGCLLVPEALAGLRDAVAIAASETFSAASAPIQYAAVSAYQGSAEISGALQEQRRLLAALGAWCVERLHGAGVRVCAAEGGFYLFPDFGPLAERLAARGITTSAELARRLLADNGVATLPGSAFGRPAEELTLRLAYVDFDGGAALQACPGRGIDEPFLQQHCGRVLEGIERICAAAG